MKLSLHLQFPFCFQACTCPSQKQKRFQLISINLHKIHFNYFRGFFLKAWILLSTFQVVLMRVYANGLWEGALGGMVSVGPDQDCFHVQFRE